MGGGGIDVYLLMEIIVLKPSETTKWSVERLSVALADFHKIWDVHKF